MCTVSFLVLPGGGYLLGTNRDESPRRGLARPPSVHPLPPTRALAATRVLAPTDSDADGTWVAVDDAGRCLCLLNGDRPPAHAPADDAPSRGRLVLELMAAPTAEAVLTELRARVTIGALREKSFKLLVARPGDGTRPAEVERIEWDGAQLLRARHLGDSLFVSSRMEPDAVADARGELFDTLTACPRTAVDALADAQQRWHASHRPQAPHGDGFSVCMHRDEARSVSFTQVRAFPGDVSMRYLAGQPCEASPQDAQRASFNAVS